jgi:hypothetical protein
MEAIPLCDNIEVHTYLRLETTKSSIESNYILFVRGDMFRPLMQPSSGQLKSRASTLMCAQYGNPYVIIC